MSTSLYDNERAGVVSWIVYINGIEIPAQSVQISYGVWQTPQATIHLVPDPILHRIGVEDRISVQAFYCDQWYHSPPQFCLMFDGELVAWGQTSTTGSRALSIVCHDYVQILTQMFFFLMSSFDDYATGASGASIGVSGNTIQLAGYGALYPYSLFSQGLADVGDGTSNESVITRPIDFAYNLVRAMIKAQHPNRAIPATNFFAPWCKRTNFHKRWVALPYFDADPEQPNVAGIFPILRAVQDTAAVSAVCRMGSNIGTSGSLWDMLREILNNVLMEVAMLPTPAAVRSDFATLLPKGPPGEGVTFLTNYFVKPQVFFALPPVCNVFFPSQLNTYAYQENIASQNTRMYFNEGATLSSLTANATASGLSAGGAQMMQDALCTGYPEEVDIAARDAAYSPGQNGRNLLVYPEEFFKGPVIARQTMPRWFSFLLEAMTTQPAPPGGGGGGGGTVDNPSMDSQGVDAGITFNATNDAAGLNGADNAVYFPLSLRARNASTTFLNQFGLSLGDLPDGRHPSAEVLAKLNEHRFGAVGGAVPPQSLPLTPASACPRPAATGAKSFFSSRGSAAGKRLHAGLDFTAPTGTVIVSTTAGRVSHIGRADTGRDPAAGNYVQITDEKRGKHRYMHMSEFATINGRAIAVGDEVSVGTVIGYVGNTGASDGPHLHYDVMSSGSYMLNYTGRLAALKAGGRPPAVGAAPDTANPQPPTQTQPAAAPPASPTPAPAPTPAPTPAPATGTGTPTPAAASEIAPVDTVRNLFKLYAACEYYKQRYSQRQGTISMPFNPYPVPGFSCAVFDRRSTALDTVGYLMTVEHSMSVGQWDTALTYTHGRTFQEMFALMQRTAALEAARLGQNNNDIEIAIRNRTAPGTPQTVPRNTAAEAGLGVPTGGDTASTQLPDAVLANFAVPVGAIAMAPAEPLEELRILQEFNRADDFYKSLFFHSPGAGADILTAEQYAQSRTTSDDVQVPYATAQEVDQAGTRDNAENMAVNAAGAQDAQAATRRVTAPVAPERIQNTAVFRYTDIVDMVNDDGDRIGVSIQGLDTTSRTRLLQSVSAVRAGTQTQRDLDILRNATGIDVNPLLPQPILQDGLSTSSAALSDITTNFGTVTAGTAIIAAENFAAVAAEAARAQERLAELVVARATQRQTGGNTLQTVESSTSPQTVAQRTALQTFLEDTEIVLRTEGARINVRGDVSLVPARGAEALFTSHRAAMQYNSRPVCTLDQYLMFLGDEALPEGEITSQTSNLYSNVKIHPAKYYVRIRRYKPGPPGARPIGNITNTEVSTDAAAGPGATSTPQQGIDPYAGIPPQLLEELRAQGITDPILLQALNSAQLVGALNAEAERTQGALARSTRENAIAGAQQAILDQAVAGADQSAEAARVLLAALSGARNATVPASTTDQLVNLLTIFPGLNVLVPVLAPLIVSGTGAASLLLPPVAVPPPGVSNIIPAVPIPADNAAGVATNGTYPVSGVPASFPDNRANWDILLERYRENVLRKLAPQL